MLRRHLIEFGVQPLIGIILAITIFVGLSMLLYARTEYAAIIYAFFALVFVSRASEVQRNNLLKQCFSQRDYKIVRLLENTILIFPFIIFLVLKQNMLIAAIVFPFAVILSMIHVGSRITVVIPTPFCKQPFEFIIGFRKSFVICLFAYALMIISIQVDNFNLGVFSLALIILISLTFYSTLEPNYYVWIFGCSPKEFLIKKIKTAWWQLIVLSSPILIGLSCFNTERIFILAIIVGVGFIYLATIILAKYAAYPNKIGLPQGILLATGFWFPPLLLVIIPYFYQRSIKQLQMTLS